MACGSPATTAPSTPSASGATGATTPACAGTALDAVALWLVFSTAPSTGGKEESREREKFFREAMTAQHAAERREARSGGQAKEGEGHAHVGGEHTEAVPPPPPL